MRDGIVNIRMSGDIWNEFGTINKFLPLFQSISIEGEVVLGLRLILNTDKWSKLRTLITDVDVGKVIFSK